VCRSCSNINNVVAADAGRRCPPLCRRHLRTSLPTAVKSHHTSTTVIHCLLTHVGCCSRQLLYTARPAMHREKLGYRRETARRSEYHVNVRHESGPSNSRPLPQQCRPSAVNSRSRHLQTSSQKTLTRTPYLLCIYTCNWRYITLMVVLWRPALSASSSSSASVTALR